MIEAEQVRVVRGGKTLLDDVTIASPAARIQCVVGPSGSGKTTLLRCALGFERVDSGALRIGGAPAGLRRELGFVPQGYALFPHCSVHKNLHLAPTVTGFDDAAAIARRAAELLERLGLRGLEDAMPAALSGGQRQRVAIARALMQEPRIILADEPVASLDPRNARVVMDALRDVNRSDGLTVLTNLHHLDTARSYCDRIVAMQNGRVMFDGPPQLLTPARVQEIYGVTEEEFEDAPKGSLVVA